LKKLESLGLTRTEAKAYLSLLTYGPLTAQQLVDFTNIPRTRIYGIIRRLQNKKLVETHHQDGQKYLSASPPFVLSERIRADYEKAVKNAEAVVQELLKIYHSSLEKSKKETEGVVRVYKSPQKTVELLERTILEKDVTEILTLKPAIKRKLVHRPLAPRIPSGEPISFVSSTGKLVRIKWLIINAPGVKKLIRDDFIRRFGGPPEQFESECVEIKILPENELQNSQTHFVVLDRKSVMVILRQPKPYLSLFVNDSAMAEVYASFFEKMWEKGIPYEEI